MARTELRKGGLLAVLTRDLFSTTVCHTGGIHRTRPNVYMTFLARRIAFALLMSLAAALPCRADSLASSASSAGSASVGSLSDSIRNSSGRSTHEVAEGDYRLIDVAAAGRPDTLRLKMEPVPRAGQDAGVIYLDVPQPALADRSAAPGELISVRQRPYGYQFAWADTRVAFFLVLADEWQRELEPRAIEF